MGCSSLCQCERCLLAHSLNNKLSVILGWCQLLSRGTDDPTCLGRLQAIRDAAEAMVSEVQSYKCCITDSS